MARAAARPTARSARLISDISGTPVPDIVWDGVTRIPGILLLGPGENKIYVDEAEGTTFANLKMISQHAAALVGAPDTDISGYKGSAAGACAGEAAAGRRGVRYSGR
jgi:hypothetical protein